MPNSLECSSKILQQSNTCFSNLSTNSKTTPQIDHNNLTTPNSVQQNPFSDQTPLLNENIKTPNFARNINDFSFERSSYNSTNINNNLENLTILRRTLTKNPMLSYYNINSLRNKFFDVQEIISKSMPDVIVLAETKLDDQFSKAQFYLNQYYEPTRKDLTKTSGGLIEYVRNGIIRKRMPQYELNDFESIASELTINKEKWLLLSFYRTERNENRLSNIRKFF